MQIKPGMEAEYQKYVEVHSENPYDMGAVKMVRVWSGMMEKAIGYGMTVAAAADVTSDAAETAVGASGTIYHAGCAALKRYWIHGDEFKEWYEQRQAQEQAELNEWYEQQGDKEMAELKAQREAEQAGPTINITLWM